MVAIEHQLHNVFFWHFGQLPREYIFEVNQHFHGFTLLIIPYHFKVDDFLFLLNFSIDVSTDKSKSNILHE